MREKLLLNDIHLGVQRVAGTTQRSAIALKESLLQAFRDMLFAHPDKDIVINGDLFDSFQIMYLDVLGFYDVARTWLETTGAFRAPDENNEAKWVEATDAPRLFLGRGNHDWAKDNSKLSSFDFICRVLKAEFGDRVVVVNEPQWLDRNLYMIPHMPNQDLFDLELKRALTMIDNKPGTTNLLLHANYDNGYTLESDHSLNVSKEQAQKLIDAGWTLIFGHEHQAREALNGGVIVAGNQWPSSVADCLNNPKGLKHAHIIDKAGDLTPVQTWSAADDFLEVDWRALDDCTPVNFIRVVGKASVEEAADAIAAIAKFRQSSDAFVITNGVVVEGVADMGELKATAENIKAFDVLGYLLEQLDDEQREVVQGLLAKNELREAA